MAGLRDLAVMAGEQPAAMKDRLEIQAEEVGIGIERLR